MRRPCRQIDVQVRVRLDRVIDKLYEGIFLDPGPGSETEFAAQFQNPASLGARAFRIGQVEKREIRYDAIEHSVRQPELLRVAFAKFNGGKHSLRDPDHFG